jgi:hypothetical protein
MERIDLTARRCWAWDIGTSTWRKGWLNGEVKPKRGHIVVLGEPGDGSQAVMTVNIENPGWEDRIRWSDPNVQYPKLLDHPWGLRVGGCSHAASPSALSRGEPKQLTGQKRKGAEQERKQPKLKIKGRSTCRAATGKAADGSGGGSGGSGSGGSSQQRRRTSSSRQTKGEAQATAASTPEKTAVQNKGENKGDNQGAASDGPTAIAAKNPILVADSPAAEVAVTKLSRGAQGNREGGACQAKAAEKYYTEEEVRKALHRAEAQGAPKDGRRWARGAPLERTRTLTEDQKAAYVRTVLRDPSGEETGGELSGMFMYCMIPPECAGTTDDPCGLLACSNLDFIQCLVEVSAPQPSRYAECTYWI